MPRTPTRDLDEILHDTTAVWPAFDGATVLLTGTSGFVGTWLLEALHHARQRLGLQIHAIVTVREPTRLFTRLPHLAQERWITVLADDVRALTLPDQPVDAVIHAASTVAPAVLAADPLGTQEMVLLGTRRVLEQSAARGARRALVISSGSVYGPPRTEAAPLREDTGGSAMPFHPGRVLAEAKRAAEAAAAVIADRTGMHTVVARGFAMAGPWLPLDANFALGNFVRDGLAGRPIAMTGDGTAIRSYLYGGDVATWLWTLLAHGRAGEAYNVGGETPISIATLATLVAERCGVAVTPPLARDTPAPIDVFLPDVTKVQPLGLRPRIDIATAIDRMLVWHRAQPELGLY